MPHKSTDDVKKEEKNEEEKEEDDDDRTETASNASSSYNDLFEAEDGEEQVASNSKGGSEPTVFESRFFVCKFEHRPKSTASEEKDGKQKAELEVPTENKENETKKIKVEVDGEQTPTIVKIENDEVSASMTFSHVLFSTFFQLFRRLPKRPSNHHLSQLPLTFHHHHQPPPQQSPQPLSPRPLKSPQPPPSPPPTSRYTASSSEFEPSSHLPHHPHPPHPQWPTLSRT